jgi:hypothetical protein
MDELSGANLNFSQELKEVTVEQLEKVSVSERSTVSV